MAAGDNYGALGTISGRIETLEFRTSGKGTRWASLTLKRGSGQIIRAKSFSKKVVPALEGYSEGDDFAGWGKIKTDFSDKGSFTTFEILSVNEEEAPSRVITTGEVAGFEADDYGDYLVVETTNNPDYEEFVRLKLDEGMEPDTFKVGEKVRAQAEPMGKFGEWTLTKLLPFTVERRRSNAPAQRFRRPGATAEAPAEPEAPAPSRPANPRTSAASSPSAAARRNGPPSRRIPAEEEEY